MLACTAMATNKRPPRKTSAPKSKLAPAGEVATRRRQQYDDRHEAMPAGTPTLARSKRTGRAESFWHELASIGQTIREEDWAFLPRDAAARFDEYLEACLLDS